MVRTLRRDIAKYNDEDKVGERKEKKAGKNEQWRQPELKKQGVVS